MAYDSNIANEVLYSPFDDMASVSRDIRRKLTEDVFLEKCYTLPDFLEPGNNYYSDEPLDSAVRAYLGDDSPVTKEDQQNEVNECRNEYHHFKNWLYDFEDTHVYTVSGNAGTGKTTLINRFKNTILNNDEEHDEEKFDIGWIVLDVTQAGNPIDWWGDYFTFLPNFGNPLVKTIGIILQEIKRRLFPASPVESFHVSIIVKRIKSIVEVFEERFSNLNIPSKGFFKEIQRYSRDTLSEEAVVENVAKFCGDYFNSIFQGIKDERGANETRAFYDTLNILFTLVRCTEEIGKKFVIVFDNFERFINGKEIYSIDVDRIRRALNYFSQHMRANHTGHWYYFKFIMVIRTSTIRKSRVILHSADAKPHDLCIDNWYSTDRILSKRFLWFYEYYGDNKEVLNREYMLLIQIFGDLRIYQMSNGWVAYTGLKQQIPPLMNYNKRLMLDLLGKIIEDNRAAKSIEVYNNLWDEDTPDARFAARSIIKGLIYSTLEQNDNLFRTIKVYSNQERDGWREKAHSLSRNSINGTEEVRKILTIINNYSLENPKQGMPMDFLIKHLLGIWDALDFWSSTDETKVLEIKKISDILYHMSSYNRRANDWIQFVSIQFRERYKPDDAVEEEEEDETSVPRKNISINSPAELRELIANQMDNLTLHIMPSGVEFLRHIVASFEFFSMLCFRKNNYIPLFASIPTPYDMKATQNLNDLKCVKILDRVSIYAQTCMAIARDSSNIEFKFLNRLGGVGIWHADRIKNDHLYYFEVFRRFINSHYVDKDSPQYLPEAEPVKDKYQALIDKISSYWERYEYSSLPQL